MTALGFSFTRPFGSLAILQRLGPRLQTAASVLTPSCQGGARLRSAFALAPARQTIDRAEAIGVGGRAVIRSRRQRLARTFHGSAEPRPTSGIPPARWHELDLSEPRPTAGQRRVSGLGRAAPHTMPNCASRANRRCTRGEERCPSPNPRATNGPPIAAPRVAQGAARHLFAGVSERHPALRPLRGGPWNRRIYRGS